MYKYMTSDKSEQIRSKIKDKKIITVESKLLYGRIVPLLSGTVLAAAADPRSYHYQHNIVYINR